jgi:hypothetical protein
VVDGSLEEGTIGMIVLRGQPHGWVGELVKRDVHQTDALFQAIIMMNAFGHLIAMDATTNYYPINP